ncbi:HNH endonuclease [Pseudomonas rossensis]|uniref:HNH endonuclease n=1 Tax=Pseudomonas rossensis TaxID=2305471 RepID=UPI00325FE607
MSISQARLKELLHYDPESGVFTWKVGRSRTRAGSIVATKDRKGYLKVMIDKKTHYLARLAFLYMDGQEPAVFVDHINGVRADNRWRNLREASVIENARNQRLHSTNTSGLPGVTWDKRGQWRAYAGLKSKYIFIGRFDVLLDAAAARKSFERRYCYHSNHGNKPGMTVVNAHQLIENKEAV